MTAPEVPGATDPPQRAAFLGASAGGVEALIALIRAVPEDFPAPLLVVLHVSPFGTSVLPEILARAGALRSVAATDGEPLRPGVVYVAPRNRHLLVAGGRAHLSAGSTEHGVRPAIDPLFRSAARAYGPRAIGVILSGMLDDGTAGLREIKRGGGIAIVQEPRTAAFADMTISALEHVDVDHVLPPAEIAELLDRLVREPAPQAPAHATGLLDASSADPAAMRTEITCPTCGGALWEAVDDGLVLYRCDARHAYTADTLLTVQEEDLESAISQPVRAMRERGALLERLARRAEQHGRGVTAGRFRMQATEMTQRAEVLERAVRREHELERQTDDEGEPA